MSDKLRRPEFRRRRKIRQRARKRMPVMRMLKAIYDRGFVAIISMDAMLHRAFADPSIDKDTYVGGGRYIESQYFFEVKP